MLGEISEKGVYRRRLARKSKTTSKRTETGKVRFCFLIAGQTGFSHGELIGGSAVTMTKENI